MSGLPPSGLRFFPGSPLEPPRAVITPSVFKSLATLPARLSYFLAGPHPRTTTPSRLPRRGPRFADAVVCKRFALAYRHGRRRASDEIVPADKPVFADRALRHAADHVGQ